MTDVTIHFLPADVHVKVPGGMTISGAAHKAGLMLRQGCPGSKLCGLCRVRLSGKHVPVPTTADENKLTQDELEDGYRLACRTRITEGLEVELVSPQAGSGMELTKPFRTHDYKVEPYIFTLPLKLPEPDLSDNLGDLDRVLRQLETEHEFSDVHVRMEFLSQLPSRLRETGWEVGAVIQEPLLKQKSPELFDVIQLKGTQDPELYGIALDIGSTTMAGYLIELKSGTILQSTALSNPQIIFGSDVISRLQLCKRKGETGLVELQNAVVAGSNRIINKLCQKSNITKNSIYIITVVGNSVMQHLLMGLNPIGLAEAPYSTVSTTYPAFNAAALGFFNGDDTGHYCSLLNLPGVSGYFGSDAVACALITTDISKTRNKSQGAMLCIDIGTNGEVILLTPDGRLMGCSTAAGPAFEGAHIKYGMPAVPGAISKLFFQDSEFTLDLIAPDGNIATDLKLNAVPESLYCQGLTGAAILDLVSILSTNGALLPDGKLTSSGELSSRIRKGENGQPEFVLVEPSGKDVTESRENQIIVLTQEDIREVQLAKGAVCAGVKTLIHHADIAPVDLKYVFMAGSFGSHITPDSVRTIGMIPHLPAARIEALGNAAGAGAVMAMTSRSKLQEFYSLAGRIEYIELATDEKFKDLFIDSMRLESEP